MIPTSDLNMGDLRLLEVDNRLIVPIETPVRVLVTAADVIHAFAVPSLGLVILIITFHLIKCVIEACKGVKRCSAPPPPLQGSNCMTLCTGYHNASENAEGECSLYLLSTELVRILVPF